MNRKIVWVLIGMLLSSCASMEKKEDVATVFGAIIGGVLGAKIGKGDGRIAGAVIGTIAGGMLGKQFGAYLDEQDRKRIVEASENAIRDGKESVYVSPKSGAKVIMTPSAPTYGNGPELTFAKDVDTSPQMVAEHQMLQAARTTSVRLSPSNTAAVKHRVDRGATVEIAAKVKNSSWVLISEDKIAIGYVNRSDLAAPITHTANQPLKKQPPTEKTEKPISSQTASSTGNNATGSSQPQKDTVGLQKVAVSTECKVLTRTIEVPNGGPSGKESIKYCNQPPKGWQPITV